MGFCMGSSKIIASATRGWENNVAQGLLIADDIEAKHHLMVFVEDIVTVDQVFAEKVAESQKDLDHFARIDTHDVLLAPFVLRGPGTASKHIISTGILSYLDLAPEDLELL